MPRPVSPSMPWTPGVATLASACLSPFVETQEGFPPAVVRPRQWPHDAHRVCAAAYYTSSQLEREQSLPVPIDLTQAMPRGITQLPDLSVRYRYTSRRAAP